MRILTRYMLRAHLGPFLFALSVLTSIVFINTIARRIEDLAGKGLGTWVIIEVGLLSLPHVIALTLPMAVLVAVLYAFSQMAADNEITALKASGVNLLRLMVPVLAAGVLLFGAMVYFNDRILPETNHRLKNLLADIARKSPTLQLREQVINEIRSENYRSRYYLRAAHIDPGTNRMRDVVIYDLSVPSEPRTVYADSGHLTFSEDQTNLLMILYDGWINQVDEKNRENFQRVYFREQLMQLTGVNTVLEREQSSEYRSDREMSLAQLQATIDTARTELDSLRLQAASLGRAAVAMALGGPAGQAPGVEDRFPPPSAAYAVNVGDFPDRYSEELNNPPPDDGSTSDYVAERSASELAAFQNRARTLQRRINEFSVEWHKKWAIPFACIVFVLIGAPLAVRFPRGGAGMVILFSVIVFGIYYISLIGGEALGDAGTIRPFVGPWLPNIAFLGLAAWGLSRIGRETSTTRGGGFDDFVHTTKEFLTRPFRRRRTATAGAGAD
ncbi:MAG: LptF/LptG family permease [Candidatus Cloacimonetes bacterium]|jgi:lipopolysaccharide export system permease protein|nr:LptF/LptG family permease [Candidatus Cloacimonadota bacterium]